MSKYPWPTAVVGVGGLRHVVRPGLSFSYFVRCDDAHVDVSMVDVHGTRPPTCLRCWAIMLGKCEEPS